MSLAFIILVPVVVALVVALALGRGAAREDRAWDYAREERMRRQIGGWKW